MRVLNLVFLSFAASFDYYFWLCDSFIATNQAFHGFCPEDAGGSHHGSGSACLCLNMNYWKTIYSCIETASNRTDNPQGALKDSFAISQQKCGPAGVRPPPLELVRERVHRNGFGQTFEQANQTKKVPYSTESHLLGDTFIRNGLDRNHKYAISTWYAVATTGFVGAIFFVQFLLHAASWLVPSLVSWLMNTRLTRLYRRYFGLPPLFQNHRAQPYNLGRLQLCFPQRLHSGFIAIYFILWVFFLCHDYKISIGKFYAVSNAHYIAKNIGWRAGIVLMYQFNLLILFAGRNNVLIWLTGWPFEVFNHWHRWMARFFVLSVLLHALGFTLSFAVRSRFFSESKKGYWIAGILATAFAFILCAQGTKSVRSLSYEVFLVVHILGAVACLVATYYHVRTLTYGLEQTWICVGFWAFDRAVRAVRVIRNGCLTTKAKLRRVGDVLVIDVFFDGVWNLRASNYAFIHFLKPAFFWQSHPLTVVPPVCPKSQGSLRIYAKAQKGVTRKLLNLCSSSESNSVAMNVWIDGLYGVPFNVTPFEEFVFITGGLGITACYSVLYSMISRDNDTKRRYHIYWAMRDTLALEWFKEELDFLARFENVVINFYITSTASLETDPDSSKTDLEPEKALSIEKNLVPDIYVRFNKLYSKLSVPDIVYEHIVNSTGPLCIFTCGPEGMCDAVRVSVARNLNETPNLVQFFEESFSM